MPRTGRPRTGCYEPRICEVCDHEFRREDFSYGMTEEEWLSRRWCSWDCRCEARRRAHTTICECCRVEVANLYGELCENCYEFLRVRDALDDRAAWFPYRRVLTELARYDIVGFGRKPALRKARLPLPREELVPLLGRIMEAHQALGSPPSTAEFMTAEEFERQRNKILRTLEGSIDATHERQSPAYQNARARMARAWAAVSMVHLATERSPLYGGFSQN